MGQLKYVKGVEIKLDQEWYHLCNIIARKENIMYELHSGRKVYILDNFIH